MLEQKYYLFLSKNRKTSATKSCFFFLNDHRPSKRLPFIAKGLRPTLFTLWKIRAVSPIKERREIDTVSDTCSIGPRKYRELHERFGARCVQNRRSNKKEKKRERERRVRGVRYIWIGRKRRTRRKGLRKAAETIRSNWIIYWPSINNVSLSIVQTLHYGLFIFRVSFYQFSHLADFSFLHIGTYVWIND